MNRTGVYQMAAYLMVRCHSSFLREECLTDACLKVPYHSSFPRGECPRVLCHSQPCQRAGSLKGSALMTRNFLTVQLTGPARKMQLKCCPTKSGNFRNPARYIPQPRGQLQGEQTQLPIICLIFSCKSPESFIFLQ